MGVQHSEVVSVPAKGTPDTPFEVKRHPKHAEETLKNPPDLKTMQDMALSFFGRFHNEDYLGVRPCRNGKYADHFEFTSYSYNKKRADDIGTGLYRIGITQNKTIGIYSENCPTWVNAIDASSLYGFVIVSLYDTLGPDALEYLLGHSKMEAVIVSPKNFTKLMERLISIDTQVKHVIINDESIPPFNSNDSITVMTIGDLCRIGSDSTIPYPQIDPEAPHFVCYSSGTTGNPKGVIISHRACVNNTISARIMAEVGPSDRHLSYLPLAHVFERAIIAITSYSGAKVGFNSGGIQNMLSDLAIMKPTFFPAVPRVLNRFYDGIMEKVNSSFLKKGLFWGSYYAKRFCIDYNLPTWLFDKLVFNSVKNMIGGSVGQFLVGAAAMDPHVHEFFQVANGIPLRTGYGLSEAGSGNVINPNNIHTVKIGTVGGPLPNVEVRLEPIDGYDDPLAGEILIGGQCLSSGYLYDEETTRNLFVDETHTWIRTGDVGKWDEDGYLVIVDRLRSIFKLSQGEYVAAEVLSQVYNSVSYINQIYIYGDAQRSYLVAIIVPNMNEVSRFMNKRLTSKQEIINACKNTQLINEILTKLREVADKEKLFGYQRIIKIALDPDPWTVENELLTPTFKQKRKKLELKYKSVIETLYNQ